MYLLVDGKSNIGNVFFDSFLEIEELRPFVIPAEDDGRNGKATFETVAYDFC